MSETTRLYPFPLLEGWAGSKATAQVPSFPSMSHMSGIE